MRYGIFADWFYFGSIFTLPQMDIKNLASFYRIKLKVVSFERGAQSAEVLLLCFLVSLPQKYSTVALRRVFSTEFAESTTTTHRANIGDKWLGIIQSSSNYFNA